MKKMMSLAAMFAVIAYASPASAEIKFGGDASVRMRGAFENTEVNSADTDDTDNVTYSYRLRLKGSADLGDGYFFKTMITTDPGVGAGGWVTVAGTNADAAGLDISQLYFGRMMENSHYMMGRLPLGSMNNPIFDLTLFPTAPADTQVATYMMDRVYGINYGCKVLGGEANATVVVLDNDSIDGDSAANGNSLFNDGYALHLTYKANIGKVTVEPQAIITLTDANLSTLDPFSSATDTTPTVYTNISPNTFGANVTIPTGNAKIGLSGFYTVCDDSKASITTGNTTASGHVDYSGYLFRVKGEVGNFMAWADYSQVEDKTAGNVADYDNLFVWAQYNFKVHESAAGSFTLSPIVRYWAQGQEQGVTETDYDRLRTELVATVTF